MDGLKDFGAWILAAAIAIIAWFSRRDLSRYDRGLERISKLEAKSVTHEQLDRLMERMTSERAAMHIENREHLQRIEDKIDTNKSELHELAIVVATKQ